jgi:uncharacterized protein with gpF-like domain
MPELVVRNLTPKDALKAFAKRLDRPAPEFSWLDLWQHEHSTAFTVAKTAGHDVLGDIGSSIEDAIASGETYESWSKKLIPILQDKGWWGTGPAYDPASGKWVESRLGSVRRLDIIYDTNLRQSYAAGRWLQIERNKADIPYLMYKHNFSRHPRAEHEAWDGICLPVDDPWWLSHYPPNAWKCHCSVIPVSDAMFARLEKSGRIKMEAPDLGAVDFTNKRTGEVTRVPKGIDPGFGYNPGVALLRALGGDIGFAERIIRRQRARLSLMRGSLRCPGA